jgi:DNA invertase Pin-like site-specific DNA recombinase
MGKIFGYMRVSTGKQDTDRQELTLNEYAKSNKFKFDEIKKDILENINPNVIFI